MKTIIFDIDGTLADIEHRRYLVTGDKKDWPSFNNPMNMEQDKPNMPIIEIYHALADAHIYRLILVTGRMEASRDVTNKWLKEYGIHYERLLMRPNGDYRPDNEIKENILCWLLETGHDILFCVDDRQQVVDMWRKNGITCLQCASGDF